MGCQVLVEFVLKSLGMLDVTKNILDSVICYYSFLKGRTSDFSSGQNIPLRWL